MNTNEEPVVIEQEFNRSTSDVWNAIVTVEEMRNWFFENIPDFNADVGFRTQFPVDSGERIFLHLWEVTEVVPQRKIVYNWKYEGYAGDSVVSFEITGDECTTRLRVTLQVLENFSDDIPEFTRESCVGGWTYFINDSLKAYLDR